MDLCGWAVLLGGLSILLSISTCLCNFCFFSWFLSKYLGKGYEDYYYCFASEPNRNYQAGYSTKRYEVLTQTMSWFSWDLMKIMKELAKMLYPLLILFGIYTFLYASLALWSTKWNACMIPSLFFKSSRDFYSNCGSLSHDAPPAI